MAKKDEKPKDKPAEAPAPQTSAPAAAEPAATASAPETPPAETPAPLEGDAPPAEAAPEPQETKAAEPPAPVGLSLEELRSFGAIASESVDGDHVDVVTKGGVALRFPGDEVKADQLSDEELFGPDSEPAADAQEADAAALRGDITPLQRAMAHWGLEERHVLGAKEYPQDDGSIEVVIVTQGGQRLRWPEDHARALNAMEKGDAVPQPVPAGIFPAKK